jgi:hypothetical protein
MSSPVADTLRALAAALQGVGQGWYLFGAQAALLRGSRRLTSDVDVTVLAGDEPTARLVERLAEQGIALRFGSDDDFVQRTRVLPLVHRDSGMPVDLVLGGPGLEELFLAAAEDLEVGGVRVPVASGEHLVVMKLLAGRDTDLDDAEAIVRALHLDLAPVAELVDAIAEGLGEDDSRAALEELRQRLGNG